MSDTDETSATTELSSNTSLRYGALNKVSNYVGRSVSKAKFVLKGDLADKHKDWLYLLNVKPNPNQTASQFLAEFGKAMIEDGEVMVVVRNRQLYIVDNYSVDEKSLDGHRYHVTNIQSLSVDEYYQADEVILLKSENEALSNYTEKLWTDYGELIGRLINRQKTANQVRFMFHAPKNKLRERGLKGIERTQQEDGTSTQPKDSQKQLINRIAERIQNDSVVPIPVIGDEPTYSEFSHGYSSKASFVEDIHSVKNQYVDDVCELVGLPPALLHGDLADNQKNFDIAVEAVFEPMLQKLVDGLQEAIFSDKEYAEGNRIKVVGLHQYNLFDIATPGDKLIAAGLAMADEIREEIGFEPLPDGLGKRLYITKNYLEMRVEGGTVDESNSSEGDNHSQQQ